MAEIPELIKNLADDYVETFKVRSEAYVKKSMELKTRGPEGLELAEPITGPILPWWPLYPWWNLFLIGPIQIPGPPHIGPFRPSKIITHGNPAYMIALVWRNPAPVNWLPGPSACQLMNGRKFQINFELVNLTHVTGGIDLKPISDTFTNAPQCIQVFIAPITNLPEPGQEDQ